MPTLLHISDLHRTADPRLSNDELLSAIFSDSARWEAEGIPWPDVIVVSGDVIQGVKADAHEPDASIAAQYAEAIDFLHKLSSKFLSSDRSRVIIVPGNHDVNWSRARRAMDPVKPCPTGISQTAFEADSGVRWNWQDQQAYEITDNNMYQSRLHHFKQFQSEFYADLNSTPLFYNEHDIVFFEDLSLGLVVVGFSSWYGNDCFCHVGDIEPAALSLSQQLLEGSSAPLAVAVWHHSIAGGPKANDYMDSHIIHRLIDFGFSVGLHGHQHFPDAAPFNLRLPNSTSMIVIAGGSLAVGDGQLPMGEQRQFNVVEIDPASHSITVHVRAMSKTGVFAGSYRNDFGGNTFIKLDLPYSPSRPTDATPTQQIDDAMTAVAEGHYEKALELISSPSFSTSATARLVKIEALNGLGRVDELIKALDQPRNTEECVRLVSLLIENGRTDEASEKLETFSGFVDQPTLRSLNEIIAIKEMI